jgi:hypothetical protein
MLSLLEFLSLSLSTLPSLLKALLIPSPLAVWAFVPAGEAFTTPVGVLRTDSEAHSVLFASHKPLDLRMGFFAYLLVFNPRSCVHQLDNRSIPHFSIFASPELIFLFQFFPSFTRKKSA